MKKRKKIILILIPFIVIVISIVVFVLALKITSEKKGIHSIFGFTFIDINQECYITEAFEKDFYLTEDGTINTKTENHKNSPMTMVNVKAKGVINKYTERFKGTIEVEGYEIDVGGVDEFVSLFDEYNGISLIYLGMGFSVIDENIETWSSRYTYDFYIQGNREDFVIWVDDGDDNKYYYVYSSLDDK